MADVSFSELSNLPARPADRTLSYGTDALQVADYWQSTLENAPLLILFHGGCWLNTYDRSHIEPLASALNAKDIAVLSVEYRRIGDTGGGWPGTFNDVNEALTKAQELGHQNVFAAGHSAGGHLALWLGTQDNLLKGVIGIAAISDLYQYAKGSSPCQRATLRLMGGTALDRADRYAAASPLQRTMKTHSLLLHGTSDGIVSPQQSDRFAAAHQSNIERMQDKGHFDLIDPRGETANLIAEQINSWLN